MLTRLVRRPAVVPLCRFASTSRPQFGVAAHFSSRQSAAKMGQSEKQQQQQPPPHEGEQGPGAASISETTTTTTATTGAESASTASQAPGGKGILPLPAPPSPQDQQQQQQQMKTEDGSRGDDVTTLRVGETLRLDALGPLVVNTDGSMARVGNWAGMTEMEREATMRLLGRRNRQRLDALKARKEAEEAASRGG